MSRSKKHHVKLNAAQYDFLKRLISVGEHSARVLRRARILLLAHEEREDLDIAAVLHSSRATVENIRRRFVHDGLDAALYEKPRPGGEPKLDAKQEAVLITLACSDPPEGRTVWTMQLLAERLVELQVVESISDETVRRRLKKTHSNPGSASRGASAR